MERNKKKFFTDSWIYTHKKTDPSLTFLRGQAYPTWQTVFDTIILCLKKNIQLWSFRCLNMPEDLTKYFSKTVLDTVRKTSPDCSCRIKLWTYLKTVLPRTRRDFLQDDLLYVHGWKWQKERPQNDIPFPFLSAQYLLNSGMFRVFK